jgi:glycosyltransferase involved in cell wall biosynthesis
MSAGARRERIRVGVNVAILATPLTGIGHFVQALMRCLPDVGGDDFQWVFLGVDPSAADRQRRDNVEQVVVDGLAGKRKFPWELFVLPRLAKQLRLDLLHCPNYSRPFSSSVPVVSTIHDLAAFSPQKTISLAKVAFARWMMRHSVTHSYLTTVDSTVIRQEIIERFSADPAKVLMIPLAHGLTPSLEHRQVNLDSPFLFYVGTLEERKNLLPLVEAYTRLRSAGAIRHRLVLAGQPGFGFETLQAAINDSPYKADIDLPGYVSREEVLRLYRSASLFVYPSLYEGFGIPILEAMASGTPVVCSDIDVLREVGADAAGFFDPRSPQELATRIREVLESPERQALMQQKGLERARLFSWTACASRYCDVYRRVLAERSQTN